jgi:hypothetical protein
MFYNFSAFPQQLQNYHQELQKHIGMSKINNI